MTDATLMRGFDYRSKVGIDLIICKSFSTERAMVQGLGRVGRNGDLCRRFSTVPYPPVDDVKKSRA